MALELDDVFCMVGDLDQVACQVEAAGWMLDSGSVHFGQGTRNRRLVWGDCYLELVGLTDRREAPGQPHAYGPARGLDVDWRVPVRVRFARQAFAGYRGDYWLYEDLGIRIWIQLDNEQAPERPLVFVLEMDETHVVERRARLRAANRGGQLRGPLDEIYVEADAPARLPI